VTGDLTQMHGDLTHAPANQLPNNPALAARLDMSREHARLRRACGELGSRRRLHDLAQQALRVSEPRFGRVLGKLAAKPLAPT
jgi:hypothetical protein